MRARAILLVMAVAMLGAACKSPPTLQETAIDLWKSLDQLSKRGPKPEYFAALSSDLDGLLTKSDADIAAIIQPDHVRVAGLLMTDERFIDHPETLETALPLLELAGEEGKAALPQIKIGHALTLARYGAGKTRAADEMCRALIWIDSADAYAKSNCFGGDTASVLNNPVTPAEQRIARWRR